MLNSIKYSVPVQDTSGSARFYSDVIKEILAQIPESSRSKYDLRVVDADGHQYLVAKKLSTFGKFKELTGWDAKRRGMERSQAGELVSTAEWVTRNANDATSTDGTQQFSRVTAGQAAEALGVASSEADTDSSGSTTGRFFDQFPDSLKSWSMNRVDAAAATTPLAKPGIPIKASPKDITQMPGTVTCWALSTLHSIMNGPGGREFLNERFTKVGDEYRLKLADGRVISVDAAKLKAINEQRKKNNPSPAYDDQRPEWVRAFECAATQIDQRSYGAAATSADLKFAASGVFLAQKLGLETSGNSGSGSPTQDIVNGYEDRQNHSGKGALIGSIALRDNHFVSVADVSKEKGTIKFVNGLGGGTTSSRGRTAFHPGQRNEEWSARTNSARRAEMTYFYLPARR